MVPGTDKWRRVVTKFELIAHTYDTKIEAVTFYLFILIIILNFFNGIAYQTIKI